MENNKETLNGALCRFREDQKTKNTITNLLSEENKVAGYAKYKQRITV